MKYKVPFTPQDLQITGQKLGKKIYCQGGQSAGQRAENDVSEITVKAFRWLVACVSGDDVELPEKATRK